MLPLVPLIVGAVLGFAYGMAKRVGRDSGARVKYAVMCGLVGLVAGGVVAIGWTLLRR